MGKPIAKDAFAKRGDESTLEWELRKARLKADARNRDDPLVTPEAANQGDYRDAFVTHVETNTKAKVAINRGGTALERWENSRKLNDAQIAVIDHMRALWLKAGIQQRVTANYGERIPGSGNADLMAASQIDAWSSLCRIRDYFVGLDQWWQVFENICRFDMPAGAAGAELNFGDNSERALTVVCFVADFIGAKERI